MGLCCASAIVCGVVVACLGCSSEQAPNASTAATGGAVTSGGGGSGSSPAATSGAAGTIRGGASGAGGSSASGVGGSGAGASGESDAGFEAGATGAGGSAGTGGSTGGSAGRGDAGPLVKASCADNDYALCLDFETGIDKTKWTGGTDGAIITTDFAHGGHAYRLYPMSGALLRATSLGAITNQIWGRFYVHFKPGAPGGHGNIVAAFDQANNWYEMGWQFDAMMGVWHAASNAERPLRSKPFIVDQWYCIELFFEARKPRCRNGGSTAKRPSTTCRPTRR